MKYWTILILLVLTNCGQRNRNSKNDRLAYIRTLINKVGIEELPYNYDMVKRNTNAKYSVDTNSMDTLFFDGQLVEGILPDTSNYYGFIYYKVGDCLVPFLTTIDKDGNKIDTQPIVIGNSCGILTVDIDSCVDRVSINRNMEINLFYELHGSEETVDSMIRICNRVFSNGVITRDGKIKINKGALEVCE